ncbi:Predicted protein [Taphrina deformans PYCC 5710]|uniref:Golgi to ER traffic protein 2 n=1 Tax=Taphrina deformans (strain PYCC 5710 / ATCC 11124 / CBS 356.35 / IMI 108563 / JCM 9778 / NBRC 8474) TaxID=1097556 RepID=R4XB90_TAPDE|nr:Predicted protein [Taphrina deformans PYCC 5710]|eukprot:CCG80593.1 Predicted protein [Taphrina deformans PYCC 5710]
MVSAQGVWSDKQKKFLSTLSHDGDDANTSSENKPLGAPITSHAASVEDDEDDPDEVDISEISPAQHRDDFSEQQRFMRQMMANPPPQFGDTKNKTDISDAQDPFGILRQMQAMQQQTGSSATAGDPMVNPFAMLQKMQQSADAGGSGSAEEFGDPLAMMNQMMGSMGGFPPQQNKDGSPGQSTPRPQKSDATTRLWRVIHFASMILILLFLERPSLPIISATDSIGKTVFRAQGQPIFWWFITVELVLQSTRLLLYGPTPQNSIVSQVAQFLPPPYSGYVLLLTRYTSIFTTLRDDFWVLLFGLGVRAWWTAT